MEASFNDNHTAYADEFLRSFGIIDDFQKNSLVLTTMSAVVQLKNVAFDIDKVKKVIVATLYVSRFFLWFGNKKAIVDQLRSLYAEYVPDYEIKITFKRYVQAKI